HFGNYFSAVMTSPPRLMRNSTRTESLWPADNMLQVDPERAFRRFVLLNYRFLGRWLHYRRSGAPSQLHVELTGDIAATGLTNQSSAARSSVVPRYRFIGSPVCL